MKNSPVVIAIAVLSLNLSGSAFAQRDRGQDSNPPRGEAQGQRQPSNRGAQNRDMPKRGNDHARQGRGAGQDHNYYRGDRMPAQYNNRNYVVNDWRGHRLSAPPRGYHWVQSGSDYLLVAIVGGVIAQILLDQ
jgi:Ni/Co efflux regulator RcnB